MAGIMIDFLITLSFRGFWSEDLLKIFLRKHKIFNKLRGSWRDKVIKKLSTGV